MYKIYFLCFLLVTQIKRRKLINHTCQNPIYTFSCVYYYIHLLICIMTNSLENECTITSLFDPTNYALSVNSFLPFSSGKEIYAFLDSKRQRTTIKHETLYLIMSWIYNTRLIYDVDRVNLYIIFQLIICSKKLNCFLIIIGRYGTHEIFVRVLQYYSPQSLYLKVSNIGK